MLMEGVLIIALSGKMGVGKDYLMEHYIIPRLEGSYSHMAFADQIKVNIASKLDLPIEQCIASRKSAELRRALQEEGTRLGRESVHPDIWIRTLESWIRLRRARDGTPNIILITDCRFANEAEWVLRHGGLLIRVDAPTRNSLRLQDYPEDQREVIANHVSETSLDHYPFQHRINNDPDQTPETLEALSRTIDDYVNKI